MPEITNLKKERSNTIVLYPYRDISFDEWPVYTNLKNEQVPYSEDWREVGFVLPYPTNKHLSNLSAKFSEVALEDGVTKLHSGDPDGLAKTFCYSLIKDLKNVSEDGEPISWAERKYKDWLFGEFQVSAWLLNTLYLAYTRYAGQVKAKEGEDEENFTESSGSTSPASMRESKSKSEETDEPTPPMDSGAE